MKTKELLPDPKRLINGLRDTGYTFNTALADIIDNSVDAGATNINIVIEMEGDDSVFVSVADNGEGMNEDELFEAMKYGAPSKADPRRLGKFGLGMKTASTAFCRRLSLVSRREKGAESMAVWDLDHVDDVGKWEIQIGSPKENDVRMLEAVAKDGAGTLVIWEKVDRLFSKEEVMDIDTKPLVLKKKLNSIIKKFREHAELTYHRFLDNSDTRAKNISMSLNGIPLEASDPFLLRADVKEKEEGTKKVASKKFKFKTADGANKPAFEITAYVLPRKEQLDDDVAKKITTRTQGIYVYRENRMIYHGGWMSMYAIEPHMNYLRVELSFDHTGDMLFDIDIKKSRILLNETVFDKLSEWLAAPRRAAEDRYRMEHRKKRTGKSIDLNKPANNIVTPLEGEITGWKPGSTDVDGTMIENRHGKTKVVLDLIHSEDGEVTVQGVPELEYNQLWRPCLIDGRRGVEINMSHPWCAKVYGKGTVNDAGLAGVGSLLWALAQAEIGGISDAVKNYFEDMRMDVSKITKRIAEELPEPKDED